jgi:hypothetical protein
MRTGAHTSIAFTYKGCPTTLTITHIHKAPVDVLHTITLHLCGGLEEVEGAGVQGVVNTQREALQVGHVQCRGHGLVENAGGVQGWGAVCTRTHRDWATNRHHPGYHITSPVSAAYRSDSLWCSRCLSTRNAWEGGELHSLAGLLMVLTDSRDVMNMALDCNWGGGGDEHGALQQWNQVDCRWMLGLHVMCIPEHPHALACTNPVEHTNTFSRSLSLAHTRNSKCTHLIRWVHHLLVIEAEAGGLVVGGRHLWRLVREQPRLVPSSCIAVGQLIEHAAVLQLRGQQLTWGVVISTTSAGAGGSRRWGKKPVNVQVKGGWVLRWSGA